MPLLQAREWRLKYSRDDGDLVAEFYIPALECAVNYDRATGFFAASALALAMRGIEGLIRNQGHMRLIVGCTLEPAEVAAIKQGENLRSIVGAAMTRAPLVPPDDAAQDALALLSWMIANGRLDVRVAVPCDDQRQPVPGFGLYHEKAGIVRDTNGNRIAFNGSINETEAGWKRNFETFHVFRSWTGEAPRVDEEVEDFERLWTDRSKHVRIISVPDAARDDLLRFLPKDDLPARLKPIAPALPTPPVTVDVPVISDADRRAEVWERIANAARTVPGGEWVGVDTCAVEPWPHQVNAFLRLYGQERPRLLIADEVGLGKTIQAGMLLRQMWLAGRARRILVLAPAGVMRQWQLELRDKFNLNWPIYDGGKLIWLPPPGSNASVTKTVSNVEWHSEPAVIASSHLMRRKDRAPTLCDDATPWDIIVLDEAHHARTRGAGGTQDKGPNALLTLMRRLRERTHGLLLLTATPMQLHPVELYDLLDLLELPAAWDRKSFLRFFDLLAKPAPSHEEFEDLARMFRAAESAYGSVTVDFIRMSGAATSLQANSILKALRDDASIPRRSLSAANRAVAMRALRRNTPIRALVSRHTRELLRKYQAQGMEGISIAKRHVDDVFVALSTEEAAVYRAVETHIATTYNSASVKKRNAVGFVMTIYRRRVASSFQALRNTLKSRLIPLDTYMSVQMQSDEDASDDESRDEVMDAADVLGMVKAAGVGDERHGIERLLESISVLPPDSKAATLRTVLNDLAERKYPQAMVFTQYTDTLDFLREYLYANGFQGIMCFSGRGGEIREASGKWRTISRDDVKKRFQEGSASVLLCTDAAAEGLNFQFCGALVNYDMPWNPMRVEQRIGRIDRLGQQYEDIRVVNLHYSGTVETEVYIALRGRIRLFEEYVGRLQPILARVPGRIEQAVLSGNDADRDRDRQAVVDEIEREVRRSREEPGIDIDEMANAALAVIKRSAPVLSLDFLDEVIRDPGLLPPGTETRSLGMRKYAYRAPGMAAEAWVTTDPAFFEDHPSSVELWSAGSPLFPREGRPPP